MFDVFEGVVILAPELDSVEGAFFRNVLQRQGWDAAAGGLRRLGQIWTIFQSGKVFDEKKFR